MTAKAQEVIDAITALASEDQHALPEPFWVEDTEALLEARNRLDALLAARLQAGDTRDVTVAECGRTTRAWLVEEQRLSRRDATRRLWLARRLPAHPEVANLFGVGRISAEHATLIISCLTDIPAQWRDPVKTELLTFACDHDPGLLGALIKAVKVRTGAEESAEAQAQRLYDSRYLNLDDTFDGAVSVNGMLDPVAAATIRAALHPLLGARSDTDERSSGQRRADALTALAELSTRVEHDPHLAELATTTGPAGQLLTTIPFTELRDGIISQQLSEATLNGTSITPNTARMIACDTGLIPAILGSSSDVLDLGRATRVWNTAQRRAAALRDQGCVFPNCQTELQYCHLHHLHHWANHGPTNHHNSAYLCRFHHWLVHHTTWTITRNHTDTIEVHRT